MDSTTARQLLRHISMFGNLDFSNHASLRKLQRKFSNQDILKAIQAGAMVDGPEVSDKFEGFKCVMRVFVDKRELHVPIAVYTRARRIVVISVVRKGRIS